MQNLPPLANGDAVSLFMLNGAKLSGNVISVNDDYLEITAPDSHSTTYVMWHGILNISHGIPAAKVPYSYGR